MPIGNQRGVLGFVVHRQEFDVAGGLLLAESGAEGVPNSAPNATVPFIGRTLIPPSGHAPDRPATRIDPDPQSGVPPISAQLLEASLRVRQGKPIPR